MTILARISKIFREGDELWCEARAEEQVCFSFRAPERVELKIGDVIAFDRGLLDGDAAVPVYSLRCQATIRVRSQDVKCLGDRRVLRELYFEPAGTTVKLIATGQVEVSGLRPGALGEGMAGFDTLADLEGYLETFAADWLGPKGAAAGPLELRQAVVDWLKAKAIPELRAAAKKL